MIEDGRIAKVTKAGCGQGEQVLNYSGCYVSSGWIDLHVHAFSEFEPYGDELDEIGIRQGVTTVVDAGSCGADRIRDLFLSAEESQTNLLAFLNISRIGLQRVDELSNLTWIDKHKVLEAVQNYSQKIVGLKARISHSVVQDKGIKPLHIARELSEATSLPLMVHIGSAPPDIEDIMPLLQARDVVTHYLNGKSNNLFLKSGKPREVLREAIKRGVHLDVGHGTASFSFKVAEAARRHGIGLDTISTDIYRGNRLNGPVYGMAHVLTKFLYLGYPLQEIIDAVTLHAAGWLNRPELGRIKVGDSANLTLFIVKDEPTELTDSEGEVRVAKQRLDARGVVVNGRLIEC
ncbi:dihydroorotase [Pullulanibacillus pueri]|uniref:Dihydroorotase n=1 Tax=Pullulanibacillus pueri TaxID=1437324 RepID=A0A8J3EK65_9BACL|nr:dihydroorotase [Pullulanibacillus pueri]GGH76348.1 dihydroorotase [Pullulanibacillus pueri]